MQNEDQRSIEYRGSGALRAYNIRESEISYLASKRILTQLETECAERFRYYYERSLLVSRGNDLITEYGCRIDGSKSVSTSDRFQAQGNRQQAQSSLAINLALVLEK